MPELGVMSMAPRGRMRNRSGEPEDSARSVTSRNSKPRGPEARNRPAMAPPVAGLRILMWRPGSLTACSSGRTGRRCGGRRTHVLVRVVAAAHQRTGLAVGEAERERVPPVGRELVRMHPARHRQVPAGRLKVLTDGDDLPAGGAGGGQGGGGLL